MSHPSSGSAPLSGKKQDTTSQEEKGALCQPACTTKRKTISVNCLPSNREQGFKSHDAGRVWQRILQPAKDVRPIYLLRKCGANQREAAPTVGSLEPDVTRAKQQVLKDSAASDLLAVKGVEVHERRGGAAY